MRISRFRLVAVVAVVLLPCFQAHGTEAEQPFGLDGYVWLDIDGQVLPFQEHAAIMDAMLSATVIGREPTERGVAEVEEIVLENEEIRFRAAFRSVDVTKRVAQSGSMKRRPKEYRDAAIFESAAYALSELLGIGRVPPVVERSVGKKDGTVQIWMEETLPEVVLVERGILEPPDALRWARQKQIMYVFDNLIANTDRNQGNLLIDRSWNIWLIDHTRAFKRSSSLIYEDKIMGCERRLWQSLLEIDDETIRQRVEPYLESQEISNLLRRRKKLVSYIEKLIKKRGEGAVLFDVGPPEAELADWGE
jgi:hypothetical protein